MRVRHLVCLVLGGFFLAFGTGLAAASPAPDDGPDVSIETPDNPPPPAKPEPKNPTYIEGRGFDFKTADGLFDLALGANLQVRFSDLKVQDVVAATEFRIRRAKL